MNLFDNTDIVNVDIEDSIKRSYLDYSMSVIIGRALPDARDGLKPVHRRILYAMNELKIGTSTHVKSARIVGEVIGKYHPHGDSAVYDALVRMAQDFSMRAPVINGQGNFGSIDGDGAAAMRYTEACMTHLTKELLSDIEKDTVDFLPNYDGTQREPDVLPSRVPNLLLNGSAGIAVGMATNIPPHSLNELVDGLLCVLENKNASLAEVMEHIKGPDFPTGGIIYGKRGIIDAYKTGRGRVKVRAKTHIEQIGNKEMIVVDELPYQVNKARLVEQIDALMKEKQIEGISEIRDESDREGIRLVIELKRDAMSEIVLNNLFRSTTMEVTFGVIMLAIYNKEPKIFTLLELLDLFLNHRKTVIIRRTIFELEKAKARAHILEGLKIALDNIDDVIALIKASRDGEEARSQLQNRYSLSEAQASAILQMRLQRLTGLERAEIEGELAELHARIEELSAVLKSEQKIEQIIREELLEIKEKFNVPRITQIVDEYDEIDIEDLIPNDPMVITITHRGYIKRVPTKSYEKQKRGGKGKIAVTTYDDDFIERFFTANAHDTLMFVTNRGQLYWLKVYKIPEGSRTAKGKAVVNLINLAEGEKIMSIIPTQDFDASKCLTFFTKNGLIKKTNLKEYSHIRSIGVRAINLDENDEIVAAVIAVKDADEIAASKFAAECAADGDGDGADVVDADAAAEVADSIAADGEAAANVGKMVFVATKKGICIKFPLASVREIGRVSRGVTAIKFKEPGDEVVAAVIIDHNEQEILSVSERGIGKRTTADEYRLTRRGGKGLICMKLSEKTKDLIGLVIVDDEMDLMALTSSGKMIRTDMQSIRKAGRNTSGVMVVRVEDDLVVSIAKCPKQDEPDEAEGDGLFEQGE